MCNNRPVEADYSRIVSNIKELNGVFSLLDQDQDSLVKDFQKRLANYAANHCTFEGTASSVDNVVNVIKSAIHLAAKS